MNHFELKSGELYAEDVPLERIAQQVGTPTYVYARTHRHIATPRGSKFGVPFKEALALYAEAKAWRGVKAVRLDYHIGSQLTSLAPVRTAIGRVAKLFKQLQENGFGLTHLDV